MHGSQPLPQQASRSGCGGGSGLGSESESVVIVDKGVRVDCPAIEATALARHRLGRAQLKPFADGNDGRPETELNFKCYRQSTNKVVGLSAQAAAFLSAFF